MAADIGMTQLTDEHLQQLVRSTNAARARRAALRTLMQTYGITYADEPSHVFRLDEGDAR
jgi:hypothetical protein